MPDPFTYVSAATRVVFGWGTVEHVTDEVRRLGCGRAFVLSTPQQANEAEKVAESLGNLAAGVFSGAEMHTPMAVTERAMQVLRSVSADCTVAIGGGSTTGLGKAIAYRTGMPQVVIPTTYAGSEATAILGQTEDNRKITIVDENVRPEVVIYDVDNTMSLPAVFSATSGLNAMAHGVESLYARNRNPVVSILAREGLAALAGALPTIVDDTNNRDARSDALYGAWLCGTVLGSVGMALHHNLCHTLGGSFNLPHAETHAIILPHATAFNAAAVPDLLAPVTEILGGTQPGLALFEFSHRLHAPNSLRELGMPEDGIETAVDIALQNPYWNPRELDRTSLTNLIRQAWAGEPPSA